ncbi:MAG: methyltransferase [Chloroflexi bacterium]|nr:methyltransferase [Chloroflexota bacterium]
MVFQPAAEQLPPHIQVMIMMHGFLASQAVHTAAELRLADLVQNGPKSTADLASATGTHEGNLYRLLRALVSLGVFSEPDPGTFGPTELSACLQSDNPRTLYNLARWIGPLQWKVLGELIYSVRTGKPAFEHLFGKEMWRYFLEDDPEAGTLFNRSMTSQAGSADERIAEAYDFSAIRTLVDVGGGHGGFLMTVLKRNPALRGILFDLPAVIEQARELVAAAGLADRIELVAGDFFQEVPKGGDAYFIRQVIKDWGDSQCQIILDNCVRAMNPGGVLLVAERILGPGRADLLDKLADLALMVDLPGGFERDEADFRKLFTTAKLAVRRIVPTRSPYKIMELVPA